MINPDDLRPAARRVPDPEAGWRARDLDLDSELVGDEFIERDPSSYVVEPDDEQED